MPENWIEKVNSIIQYKIKHYTTTHEISFGYSDSDPCNDMKDSDLVSEKTIIYEHLKFRTDLKSSLGKTFVSFLNSASHRISFIKKNYCKSHSIFFSDTA
jgi:hypothetical protein